MDLTYILPIRSLSPESASELAPYLRMLSEHLPVIVVDGSPPEVFEAHARAWAPHVAHLRPFRRERLRRRAQAADQIGQLVGT